jgi:hypothetical protein
MEMELERPKSNVKSKARRDRNRVRAEAHIASPDSAPTLVESVPQLPEPAVIEEDCQPGTSQTVEQPAVNGGDAGIEETLEEAEHVPETQAEIKVQQDVLVLVNQELDVTDVPPPVEQVIVEDVLDAHTHMVVERASVSSQSSVEDDRSRTGSRLYPTLGRQMTVVTMAEEAIDGVDAAHEVCARVVMQQYSWPMCFLAATNRVPTSDTC